MPSLKDAKAEVQAVRGRLAKAVHILLGARVTAAAAAMFAIAFGMTLLVAPGRLPPVGGLSLVGVGLPELEFLGKEKEVAGDIIDAARRQGGEQRAKEFFEENPQAVPYANMAGLAASLLLFGLCLRAQTLQFKRGVTPL
jgi:hypothetical protein